MEDLDLSGMVDSGFWRDKRVLLTGHTGFKGSWTSLWLQLLGARLTGLALTPPTQPSLFEEAGVARGMTSVIGDIRDYGTVLACVRDCRPEIILHMAAQPLVRQSYLEPVETYATNVLGTVHLLEAARVTATGRAIVVVTSDKCYENREHLQGYREDDPMGGHDPYSSSKGCTELVTRAYRDSFFSGGGCALASARAGNVIGGGDWAADRLIPDLLRDCADGTPVRIRNPHAIRPWQHVLEPLSGYLMLAERLYTAGDAFAGAWNFGPETRDEQPVEHLVEQLIRHWGDGASWQRDDRDHPHEASFLKLVCDKARQQLNWQPVWSLDQALERIVRWHKAWLRGEDMHGFSCGEINDYMRERDAG